MGDLMYAQSLSSGRGLNRCSKSSHSMMVGVVEFKRW